MRGPHYRKAPLMKGELSPKATERFGRNDFENLSGMCFANATAPERGGFIRGEKRPPLDRGGLPINLYSSVMADARL